MQRFLLVPALLALPLLAACSSGNKNNNTPSVTAVSGNLVAKSASPVAGASTPSVSIDSLSSATPAAALSPRPGNAATPSTSATPIAAVTTTPSAGTTSPAPTASSTAAAPSAATTAPAPASANAPSAAATSAPTSAPTTAPTTAPITAPAAAAAAQATSPSGGPSDPRALIDAIKPADSDLPSGFSAGQFSGYQANEQSITGYADPQSVLNLLNSTGRQDGFVQQVMGPDGPEALTIQAWQDAAGAKAFFDQHPVPDSSVQFKSVQLDQQLGDQYQALLIGSGAGSSYALSWRVGRVVLGVGGAAGADGKPAASLLQLAALLTKRAISAEQ